MAYPNIQSNPFGLPDPFEIAPHYIAVPLTFTEHVSASQTLDSNSSLTLTSSQLLAPLILNMTGASTGPFILPTAQQIQNSFGRKQQVQIGDVFSIPIFPLATDANSVIFLANPTGGSGSKTVPAYGTLANPTSLTLVITNKLYPNSAYTLQ